MLKKRIILLLSFAFLIVAANVYASQSFSPLFYDLVYYKKRAAVVDFLRKIEHENEFQIQYQYLKAVWGERLGEDVFKDTVSREQKTRQLSALLEKNPKSRDVLLSLSLLYYDGGNIQKASEYYQKAKEIDPWVSIPLLEVNSK